MGVDLGFTALFGFVERVIGGFQPGGDTFYLWSGAGWVNAFA
ncbi:MULTISPECIES: hypothetical protein [Enterobacterales]